MVDVKKLLFEKRVFLVGAGFAVGAGAFVFDEKVAALDGWLYWALLAVILLAGYTWWVHYHQRALKIATRLKAGFTKFPEVKETQGPTGVSLTPKDEKVEKMVVRPQSKAEKIFEEFDQ